MPSIKDFRGGLVRVARRHLINPTQGREYINIDHTNGGLKPVDIPLKTGTDPGGNRAYFFDNAWQGYADDTTFAEYNDYLYAFTPGSPGEKTDGVTTSGVGLDPPTNAITVSANNGPTRINNFTLDQTGSGGDIPDNAVLTYILINDDGGVYAPYSPSKSLTSTSASNTATITTSDGAFADDVRVFRLYNGTYRLVGTIANSGDTLNDSTYDISANASIDDYDVTGFDGVVRYALTFVSTVGPEEIESDPKLSPEINVTNGTVDLSTLEVGTGDVTSRRLYRIGGNLTSYTLVADLDNVVTTYADTTPDSELEGDLLPDSGATSSPSNLRYVIEAYAMFFGAQGNKLRFTPTGKPDDWPAENFIQFPNGIRGIAKVPTGILVFDFDNTYIVTGNSPETLSRDILSRDQGCVNGYTVVETQGAAWWLSKDGMCVSNGGVVKVWSREFLARGEFGVEVNAVVHDQIYHLLTVNGILYSADPLRNCVIEYDYTDMLGANEEFVQLVVANDVLYLNVEDTVAGTNELWSAYQGGTPATYTMHTKRFIGQNWTDPKTYRDIEVFVSIGDGTGSSVDIDVEIDEVIVASKTLSTTGAHRIKIPGDKLRGYSIAFILSGDANVTEITWKEGDANV